MYIVSSPSIRLTSAIELLSVPWCCCGGGGGGGCCCCISAAGTGASVSGNSATVVTCTEEALGASPLFSICGLLDGVSPSWSGRLPRNCLPSDNKLDNGACGSLASAAGADSSPSTHFTKTSQFVRDCSFACIALASEIFEKSTMSCGTAFALGLPGGVVELLGHGSQNASALPASGTSGCASTAGTITGGAGGATAAAAAAAALLLLPAQGGGVASKLCSRIAHTGGSSAAAARCDADS